MSRASSSPERAGKADYATLLQTTFCPRMSWHCDEPSLANLLRSGSCKQGSIGGGDIGLLENGGTTGHSEEDVGNLWLELQTFREGLLQEHSRPKIATLDEPEPEAAPEIAEGTLAGFGKKR